MNSTIKNCLYTHLNLATTKHNNASQLEDHRNISILHCCVYNEGVPNVRATCLCVRRRITMTRAILLDIIEDWSTVAVAAAAYLYCCLILPHTYRHFYQTASDTFGYWCRQSTFFFSSCRCLLINRTCFLCIIRIQPIFDRFAAMMFWSGVMQSIPFFLSVLTSASLFVCVYSIF